jgi:hypothetical protein
MDFHPQKSFAYGTLYTKKIIQKLSLEVSSAIEM